MKYTHFKTLEHTADLKIRAWGVTHAELFVNALVGMFQSIRPIATACYTENDYLVCPTLSQRRDVKISSHGWEFLLVDFLSEALYLSDTLNEAYMDAEFVELREEFLQATLYGVQIQGFEVVEIKAVTYHDLHIRKESNKYVADIVFDI